jgi:hypothetical protein
MIARPEINSRRSGRNNFTTRATIAGSAMAHASHIAPSRAYAAMVSAFNGNDLVAGS